MKRERWWANAPHERFWLESTDRDDLGVDLRAPLLDDSGNENWRYTLFREAEPGDIVFHYDKRVSAITAASRIAGTPVLAPIVWAARGSYARGRGAQPTNLPGYRIALSDHRLLSSPVTLAVLREDRERLREIYDWISASNVSRYFPFELSSRPVRPLQGYAFKLPAAFVAAYPAMHAVIGLGPMTEPGQADVDRFHDLVDRIEEEAGSFAIVDLQRRRTEIGGLARQAKSIFGIRNRTRDWAFHYGGRGELQFNVGLDVLPDGGPAFRAGVAFSLETSRSLPDIARLEPRIAWFNSWMRDQPEAFPDFAMWHYQRGKRSADYGVGPIPGGLVRPGTFIFVGDRQPLSNVDPRRALQVMDQLLPLWDWVESRRGLSMVAAMTADQQAEARVDTLDLAQGRELEGNTWTRATTRAQTFDVNLRHREMQHRLKAQLLKEGCAEVIFEPPIGSRAIDVVARHGKLLWFYEIKTAWSDRACLREAIGQLLEYSLWPGATKPAKIIVVGEPPLTDHGRAYLDLLNTSFPVPIGYRQLALG